MKKIWSLTYTFRPLLKKFFSYFIFYFCILKFFFHLQIKILCLLLVYPDWRYFMALDDFVQTYFLSLTSQNLMLERGIRNKWRSCLKIISILILMQISKIWVMIIFSMLSCRQFFFVIVALFIYFYGSGCFVWISSALFIHLIPNGKIWMGTQQSPKRL